MGIDKGLENLTFTFDLGKTLLEIKATTTSNNYYLRKIIELQIESIELQKGLIGQELETSVESRIEMINDKISELVQNDLINGVDFSED